MLSPVKVVVWFSLWALIGQPILASDYLMYRTESCNTQNRTPSLSRATSEQDDNVAEKTTHLTSDQRKVIRCPIGMSSHWAEVAGYPSKELPIRVRIYAESVDQKPNCRIVGVNITSQDGFTLSRFRPVDYFAGKTQMGVIYEATLSGHSNLLAKYPPHDAGQAANRDHSHTTHSKQALPTRYELHCADQSQPFSRYSVHMPGDNELIANSGFPFFESQPSPNRSDVANANYWQDLLLE